MNITYNPCLDPIVVKVLPDFEPEMILALKWQQLSSGNWYAIDRTSSADVYASNFRIYNKEGMNTPTNEVFNRASINGLIAAIEENRVNEDNVLVLSNFSNTEHIFGEDIDYTVPITVTIDTKEAIRRTQGTWKGWGLSLRAVALSPLPFKSIDPALPSFRLINVGVDADSDRTIDKSSTYNNTFSYDDHDADYGTFIGTFIFTNNEMARFRRFMAINRGADVTIPALNGIQYPFGRRSAAYPTDFKAKIIAWENEKMYDMTRWSLQLTLAEVIEAEGGGD